MNRVRRITLIAACAVAAAIPCGARGQEAIEPQAKAALEAMVQAYRSLHSLEQDTTYSASGTMARSMVKSRLVIQRPNRLLLEVTQRTAERAEPVLRRFLSDGKDLYSYNDLQNYYSKDKAPRDLAGFRELASSIEMAALMGVDPFQVLAAQAKSVKMETPAEVDGVPTDVVLLDSSNPDRTAEVRFYLGQKDHLIRRFTLDSKEIPKPEPPKPAQPDPNDDPNLPPLEPLGPPPPVHFEYVNQVYADRAIPGSVFHWQEPPGALLYQGATAFLNQKGKAGRYKIASPLDLYNTTEPLDLSKPTRKVSARELVEKANKQRK